MTKETKPRPIRMTDQQWDDYREYLGNAWLMKKIAEAVKLANRKQTVHKTEE